MYRHLHYRKTHKAFHFFDVGIETAAYGSLACIPVGIPCDYVVDPVDAFNTCVFNRDAFMCGATLSLMAIPYVPAAPIKAGVMGIVRTVGAPFELFMAKFGTEAWLFIGKKWKSQGKPFFQFFETLPRKP